MKMARSPLEVRVVKLDNSTPRSSSARANSSGRIASSVASMANAMEHRSPPLSGSARSISPRQIRPDADGVSAR